MNVPTQLSLGAEAPSPASEASPARLASRPAGERHRSDTPPRRGRGGLVLLGLTLWAVTVVLRLYGLQVERHEDYLQRARSQQLTVVELEAPRGTIFDAVGRELAVSVKAESVFIDPSQVEDASLVATALASVLDLDPESLIGRIESGGRFLWVERKIEPEKAKRVRDLELEGVHFLDESRRHYPLGSLASQLLGFVGTDHRGLAGLESTYDEPVAGRSVPRPVLRDGAHARLVPPAALAESAVAGADLHLTLDATLQHIAERELEKAVVERQARAGTVVLLDARDSAILAMASYPTFDPNDFASASPESWRNRAVMDAFEPGSTFKMVTAAAVLDSLLVHPDDRFDCESGGISLLGVHIRDHKPFGILSFREIIARSSNVGVIKAALAAGPDRLRATTEMFGFGRASGVDLPGENSGIVRREEWSQLTAAYASFGHGLSITPLQLANAYAALANGGRLHTPYIVAGLGRDGRIVPVERPAPLELALSPSTLQTVMRLLEGVVEEGTGKAAQVPGYRVAGKTGTAEKSDRSGYSATGRIASFLGIAPSRRPRLVCLVAIDEPRHETGGGVVAAPVFGAIVEQALLYLGIPPVVEEWQDRSQLVRLDDGTSPDPAVARAGAGPSPALTHRTPTESG